MNQNKRKSKLKNILFLTIFILTISGLLAFGIIEAAKDVLGIKSEDVHSEVTIPKGASTGKIANILKENKIIKFPSVFKIYSKVKKSDNTYREGTYNLNSKMSYEDIIYLFQSMTKRTDVVRVTIPEGFTVNQIAKLLKESGVLETKQGFIDEINKKEYTSESLKSVEDNELICFKAEGYLFPDTYDIVINEKPKYIIEMMLKNFDKKVFNKLKTEINKSDLKLNDIITLASIVQKESTNFEVMKKVASVFFNRLNNPSTYPRLQSDVTILYVESDIKPNLEMKNQKMYDSYNTYERKGLPVGPICNPGLESIQAVLTPDKTDYNYFLTDSENNYYWAQTLSEHNNNLYKASQTGSVRGLDTE